MKRAWPLLATSLASLCSCPAWGQAEQPGDAPAAEAGDSSLNEAREHFNRGVSAYEQGDYESARLEFHRSYALRAHPAVLLNVAQATLLAGQPAQAANLFAQYLRETQDDPERSTLAESGLDEARAQALALQIQVDQDGALVRVDDSEIGKSPLSGLHFVSPGDHNVSADHGFDAAQASVSGQAGESQLVLLTLRATEASTTAVEPVSPLVTPAAPTVPPDDRSGPLPWLADHPWGWVGVGIAGAGLGSSLLLAVLAHDRYAAADETRAEILAALDQDRPLIPSRASACGPPALDDRPNFTGSRGYADACAQWSEQTRSGDRLKTWSWISLVTGIVAAGGTTSLYLLDSPDERRNSTGSKPRRLVISGSVGDFGFQLQGSF